MSSFINFLILISTLILLAELTTAQLDLDPPTSKTNSKSHRSYKIRSFSSRNNSSSQPSKDYGGVSTSSSRSMSDNKISSSLGEDDTNDFVFDHLAEESRDEGVRSSSWNNRDRTLPSVAPRHSYSSEKYPSSASSGTSGSIYANLPYGAYSTYPNYYANPLLDTYPYFERERAARELASRVSSLNIPSPGALSAAASSIFPSVQPFDIDAYGDALALASGHGWGWGKDHKDHKDEGHDVINHYVSKVNTNAIGLLGLLGLLSLLSNVLLLLTTTTTTTAAARRKRSAGGWGENDLSDLPRDEESEEAKRHRIFIQVLPYLAPVAHATDGRIPSDCTLQGICLTNRLLVKEYGFSGRPAASRITSAIVKLLGEVNGERGKVLGKRIQEAGLKGRNQKDCHKSYPVCKALETNGAHSFPFIIRMDDVPKLLEKVKEVTSYAPTTLN